LNDWAILDEGSRAGAIILVAAIVYIKWFVKAENKSKLYGY
jgi:hypothetical protein